MPVFSRVKQPDLQISDTDKNQLHEVPSTRGDGKMLFADLVGQPEIDAIVAAKKIEFHSVGDTGVGSAEQDDVAMAMSHDINVDTLSAGPVFLVHLGDVIYGNNKGPLYANRFYRPNKPYLNPAKGVDGIILGVPGNHDGEVRVPEDNPSLTAFTENFCTAKPPEAVSFGAKMPNQPGPYWHLDAPFVDIVGLYSNSAEDFGTLSGVNEETLQIDWLGTTLRGIAETRRQDSKKALILAVHHPPYSRGLLQGDSRVGGHPSSPLLMEQIDTQCAAAGIWPDVVLAGHSHSYQRYRRKIAFEGGTKLETSFFVVGTGGIAAQPEPSGIGRHQAEPVSAPGATCTATYVTGLKSYGYLRVAVTAVQVQLTFVRVDGGHRNEFETVTLDLATQTLISP